MLCEEFGVGKDLLVEGSRVGDDTSNIDANVAGIGPGRRYITASSNRTVVEKKISINAAGRQTGKTNLVPPTDVDDGIRKMQSLDMVQDVLLLHT